MKRFENSVRVITTLFAALLGFGLKTLLDDTVKGKNQLGLPAFVISLLLFASFLVGSLNFLWWKFVQPDSSADGPFNVSVKRIVFEFGCLILLGAIGIKICYAESPSQFWGWQSVFGLAATCFCAIYVFVDRDWKFLIWLFMNLVHAVVPFVMLLGIRNLSGIKAGISHEWQSTIESFGSNRGSWIVAAVYLVIFVIDIGFQFTWLRAIGMPLVGRHLSLAEKLRDAGVNDLEEAKRHCRLITHLNASPAERAAAAAILRSIR